VEAPDQGRARSGGTTTARTASQKRSNRGRGRWARPLLGIPLEQSTAQETRACTSRRYLGSYENFRASGQWVQLLAPATGASAMAAQGRSGAVANFAPGHC
jgi:hypothetical protein